MLPALKAVVAAQDYAGLERWLAIKAQPAHQAWANWRRAIE
jgi:hypothetical protein